MGNRSRGVVFWLWASIFIASGISHGLAQVESSGADIMTSATLTATPRPVAMLKDCFSQAFAQDAVWNDGTAELVKYQASAIMNGRRVEYEVRMATKLEGATKEFYTVADYPYGQKPIETVLYQTSRWEVARDGEELDVMTTLMEPVRDFGRALKFTVSSHEGQGSTSKVFELWGDKPRMTYASHWDGEGTSTRELGSNLDDYFEEELPLALRGLKFRDRLRATLWLYPPQATSHATEPRAVPAILDVSAGNDSWIITVKARDEREIDFVFAAKPPFVMKEYRHSDGRVMILKDVQRGNSWADFH
ncbi:hypothetical protein IT570_10200 [Candidatus Sumerlaeota bacterium]|nr:hypothetical protein [Candidatus Sumerlaeota bacterium]